jgi:hypothetical protein
MNENVCSLEVSFEIKCLLEFNAGHLEQEWCNKFLIKPKYNNILLVSFLEIDQGL